MDDRTVRVRDQDQLQVVIVKAVRMVEEVVLGHDIVDEGDGRPGQVVLH